MDIVMRNPIVPTAILMLPSSNKALLTYAKAVHERLSGNANFPNPNPALEVLAVDIKAFDDAETKAKTKVLGATEARDAKRQKVTEDLKHIRDRVQSIAETQASYRDAAAVITGAFMSVKKTGKRTRNELSAKNTGVSGIVLLEAKSVAPAATYFWQYSLDQETWTSVPATMQVKAMISGLTPAATYYFRFRALTRAGEIDFSQVVSLLVH
jgi:hypothetical protein